MLIAIVDIQGGSSTTILLDIRNHVHQTKGLEVNKYRLLEMISVIIYYDTNTDMDHGAIHENASLCNQANREQCPA